MNLALAQKEREIFDFLLKVNEEYSLGATLRVAGGWVRDKLLGKNSKDIDIAIDNMSGIVFARYVKKYADIKGIETSVGEIKANPDQSKHLETAVVRLFGESIDFINLRTEKYSPDSRIPEIVPTSDPAKDADRRDFTINALFYNINNGEIEDFTGKGMEDLKAGVLRTPINAEETFVDDPLRVLRAIRFAAKYGFDLDPQIESAAKQKKIHDLFSNKVSRERVEIEFRKMLSGPNPRKALELIKDVGLLDKIFVLPGDYKEWDMEQNNPNHTYTVWGHTMSALENLQKIIESRDISESERFVLNLSAFMHDVGKLDPSIHGAKELGDKIVTTYHGHEEVSMKAAEILLRSLPGITIKEIARVKNLIDAARKVNPTRTDLKEVCDRKSRALRKFVRTFKEDWEDAIDLAAADSSGKAGIKIEDMDLTYFKTMKDKIREMGSESIINMKPLLDGNELMEIFGRKGGPWLGKINAALLEWQLENPDGTKQEAEDYAKEIYFNLDLQKTAISRRQRIKSFSSRELEEIFDNSRRNPIVERTKREVTKEVPLWRGIRDSKSVARTEAGWLLTPNPNEEEAYRKLWFVPGWNEEGKRLAESYADFAIVKVRVPFKFVYIDAIKKNGEEFSYMEEYAPAEPGWERSYQVQEYYLYNGDLEVDDGNIFFFKPSDKISKRAGEIESKLKISFPEEEWQQIKKDLSEGKTVYTTRILNELGKYNEQEVYETPWGEFVIVTSQDRYADVSLHPFENKLTEDQRLLISGMEYDVIGLNLVRDDKLIVKKENLENYGTKQRGKIAVGAPRPAKKISSRQEFGKTKLKRVYAIIRTLALKETRFSGYMQFVQRDYDDKKTDPVALRAEGKELLDQAFFWLDKTYVDWLDNQIHRKLKNVDEDPEERAYVVGFFADLEMAPRLYEYERGTKEHEEFERSAIENANKIVDLMKRTYDRVYKTYKEYVVGGPSQMFEESVARFSIALQEVHTSGSMLEYYNRNIRDPSERITVGLLDRLSSMASAPRTILKRAREVVFGKDELEKFYTNEKKIGDILARKAEILATRAQTIGGRRQLESLNVDESILRDENEEILKDAFVILNKTYLSWFAEPAHKEYDGMQIGSEKWKSLVESYVAEELAGRPDDYFPIEYGSRENYERAVVSDSVDTVADIKNAHDRIKKTYLDHVQPLPYGMTEKRGIADFSIALQRMHSTGKMIDYFNNHIDDPDQRIDADFLTNLSKMSLFYYSIFKRARLEYPARVYNQMTKWIRDNILLFAFFESRARLSQDGDIDEDKVRAEILSGVSDETGMYVNKQKVFLFDLSEISQYDRIKNRIDEVYRERWVLLRLDFSTHNSFYSPLREMVILGVKSLSDRAITAPFSLAQAYENIDNILETEVFPALKHELTHLAQDIVSRALHEDGAGLPYNYDPASFKMYPAIDDPGSEYADLSPDELHRLSHVEFFPRLAEEKDALRRHIKSKYYVDGSEEPEDTFSMDEIRNRWPRDYRRVVRARFLGFVNHSSWLQTLKAYNLPMFRKATIELYRALAAEFETIPLSKRQASLKEYKRKRDTDKSGEPSGKRETGRNEHRFVVQEHDADVAKLHWDLRLENDDGTLSSWAVPKAKLPDDGEKLLAIKTEDHGVDYIDFSGEIKEGYGKGDVEIRYSGRYNLDKWTNSSIKFSIPQGDFVLKKTDGDRWLFMRQKK